MRISPETIYRWIYAAAQPADTSCHHLRRTHRGRGDKAGTAPGQTPVSRTRYNSPLKNYISGPMLQAFQIQSNEESVGYTSALRCFLLAMRIAATFSMDC